MEFAFAREARDDIYRLNHWIVRYTPTWMELGYGC